jgi:hypothetical protein
MILPWKNYLQTNEVSFQLSEEIKYIAYPDGRYGVLKQEIGKEDIFLLDHEWNNEKIWISDNFSDIYGIYEPVTEEELEEDDDKMCYFGKTNDGLYLDRLQRPEYVMNHDMTSTIITIDGWGIIHTPDNGESLWKTEWCDGRDEFYNCMRCDVFPENPGWKQMNREDVYEKIRNTPNTQDVEILIGMLESRIWPSPATDNSNIIGEWLIP